MVGIDKKCLALGRYWSSLFWIPGRGDYHKICFLAKRIRPSFSLFWLSFWYLIFLLDCTLLSLLKTSVTSIRFSRIMTSRKLPRSSLSVSTDVPVQELRKRTVMRPRKKLLNMTSLNEDNFQNLTFILSFSPLWDFLFDNNFLNLATPNN